MERETVDVAEPVDTGFSPTKKRLLETLKRSGERSLTRLAADLGISKMATLKHLAVLEDKGFVERAFRPEGRGRPRAYFRLTQKSSQLFPQAYAQLTRCALQLIEEKLGRETVVQLLRNRTQQVYAANQGAFEGEGFAGRVQALVELRDQGGYMAERGRIGKNTAEVLEHNCPILAIADVYGEACSAEVEMFQKLLRADVEATHRVVAGDSVCRFLIRRRSEYHA